MSAHYKPVTQLKAVSLAALAAVALFAVALAADRTPSPTAAPDVAEQPSPSDGSNPFNQPAPDTLSSPFSAQAPLPASYRIEESGPHPFRSLEESFKAAGKQDPAKVFPDCVQLTPEYLGRTPPQSPVDCVKWILINMDDKSINGSPLMSNLAGALECKLEIYQQSNAGTVEHSFFYFLLASPSVTQSAAKDIREWISHLPNDSKGIEMKESWKAATFQNLLMMISTTNPESRDALMKSMWNFEGYNPPGAQALYDYGIALAKRNQAQGAIQALQEIYQRWPDWRRAADIVFEIGKLFDDMGRYAEAVKWYKILLAEYPEYRIDVKDRLTRVGSTAVSIDGNALIQVNGQPIPEGSFLNALTAARQSSPVESVWISAAANAPASAVIRLVEICRAAGFKEIEFKDLTAVGGYYGYVGSYGSGYGYGHAAPAGGFQPLHPSQGPRMGTPENPFSQGPAGVSGPLTPPAPAPAPAPSGGYYGASGYYSYGAPGKNANPENQRPNMGLLQNPSSVSSSTNFEIRQGELQSGPGLAEMTVLTDGQKVYVHETPLLTIRDVNSTAVVKWPEGKLSIAVEFTRNGARILRQVTNASIGKPLVILMNGAAISALSVKEEMRDGRVLISGNFTEQQARRLADEIQAGKLRDNPGSGY